MFDGGVDEARRLLGEIDGIQIRTRADFRDGTWQWLAVWAIVCAGAAASAFTPFAGWYWMLGAPLGMAVTMVVSVRAETRIRLKRRAWPSIVTGVGMGVANTIVWLYLDGPVIVVGIWVVLGFGFAVLTSIDRVPSAPRAFVMLSILCVVGGVAVRDAYSLYPVLAMAFCMVLATFAVRVRSGVPG